MSCNVVLYDCTRNKQTVTAHPTIHHDDTYVVPSTIDIDGLSVMPSKIGLLKETQRKLEMLHFGYVA
jgi:hypothetical protein